MYKLFETWYLRCAVNGAQPEYFLLWAVIWMVCVSSYAEWLSWRRSRERRRLRIGDLGIFPLRQMPCTIPKYSRCGVYVLQVLAMVYAALYSMFDYGDWNALVALVCVFIVHFLALFSTDIMIDLYWSMNLFYFIGGVVLGATTGPVYLILTILPKLRKSGKWHIISSGANAGFAFTFCFVLLILNGSKHTTIRNVPEIFLKALMGK